MLFQIIKNAYATKYILLIDSSDNHNKNFYTIWLEYLLCLIQLKIDTVGIPASAFTIITSWVAPRVQFLQFQRQLKIPN